MLSRCRVLLSIVLVVALSSAVLWAAKEFVPPKAANANTYPSKDAHPNEKVTAAVDVYNTAPKDDIFITHYSEEGILPVLLIITNDGDQPITLKDMRAEWMTARRTKLEALDVDDVFRRVAHIQGSSNPRTVGPITLAGRQQEQEGAAAVRRDHARPLRAPKRSSRTPPSRAFCSLTWQNVQQPVAGAHIYLTGMQDNSGNELMYFEIPVIASNAAAPGGQ